MFSPARLLLSYNCSIRMLLMSRKVSQLFKVSPITFDLDVIYLLTYMRIFVFWLSGVNTTDMTEMNHMH